MKKFITIVVLLMLSCLSAYNIGDTVGDLSWTDNFGEFHSIHEVVNSGKIILFFWGENW